ncbi:C-type lectin domain family 4 member K [Toxocara canis]|uniref:C-type lectin domain family 4 member K n=1 Tax=Toxocara canis TaxID=6265 RepID=A0A0B2VT45_TOXCA|nr:C-type lectin domain family 4 member K [Toxocara canis]
MCMSLLTLIPLPLISGLILAQFFFRSSDFATATLFFSRQRKLIRMIKELLLTVFLLQLAAPSSQESDCQCTSSTTGKPNLWDVRLGIIQDEIDMITKAMNLSSDLAKKLKTEEANIVEIVKKCRPTLPECEPGWSYYKPTDSCYIMVRGRFSYMDAEKGCKERGANVTSMHSQGESDFIQGLAGDNMYWIGLVQNGEWHWADGSPLTYVRWRKGEPNGCCGGPANYTTVNCYPVTTPAEWDDGPGTKPWSNRHNYVCKKPSGR